MNGEGRAVVPAKEKNEKMETVENKNNELSPMFVEVEKMFDKIADITRDTARKAFEFFQKRGGEFGKELEDWFNAESKILRPVPVEITETEGRINVSAAVPGFKPEEIEISVKDNLLIMSGKTEKSEEKKDDNVVYSDWESNRFFRQLTLPSNVDADNVKAELKDGMLTLTLPKIAEQDATRVAVSAG